MTHQIKIHRDKMTNTDEKIKEVTGHELACNEGLHDEADVKKSQPEFDCRVVDPYDKNEWMSWEMIGCALIDERHKIE